MVELFLQGDSLGMREHGGIARCKYRKIFLRDIQQQSVLRRRQCQCRLFTLELGGAKTEEQLRPIERLRSEEHTSELQSLMRISYAVFCLTKKKISTQHCADN